MTKPVYVRALPVGSGIPKICAPVTGRDLPSILAEAKAAADAGADLIEWRMDFWEEEQKEEKLEETLYAISGAAPEVPVIFTIRTEEEGGCLKLTPQEYMHLNQIAAESRKADLIDVEYLQDPDLMKDLIGKLRASGALVIASTHDFIKTGPEDDLMGTFRTLDLSGADILKMAVMASSEEDTERLMACTKKAADSLTRKPVITMAMGEKGTRSRIEGELFGSSLTFGITGKASAPGQIPMAELRKELEAVHRKKEAEKILQ